MLDEERCDQVLQFTLLEAGRQDDFLERELGPIHLLKYVYLADLAFAEAGQGVSFTGARWRFHHYGPWAGEVHQRIEPALAAIHANRNVISSNYDGDFIRWRLTDDVRHRELEQRLPHRVTSSVRRSVRQFGRDTAELLNHVYTTNPMRRASPGSDLLLFVADPNAPASAPPSSSPPLTARQQKKQRERLAKAKQSIKEKLEARRAARAKKVAVPKAPRYDGVFDKGLQWLDVLAG